MAKHIIALLSGIIFGIGLTLSQMVNPSVVIGFLDVLGKFNPALLYVMVTSVLINLIAFRLIYLTKKPVLDTQFYLPVNTDLEKKLVVGSIIFGLGWGLTGICPGPSIVNMVTQDPKIFGFVAAMALGMVCHR